MADEVKVTVVFLVPKGTQGTYETKEFSNVYVNTRASGPRLISALLDAFPEVKLERGDVDIMVQSSDGSIKGVNAEEGSRIMIMPKVTGDIVRREK